MSSLSFTKTLIAIAIFGYLAMPELEARTLDQQDPMNRNIDVNDLNALAQLLEQQGALSKINLDSADNDDDDDGDDDRSNIQAQNPLTAATVANQRNNLYNDDKPIQAEQTNQEQNRVAPSSDLKTSASHHHHGHHAKGWLDMGAWTGKKGAFGWHDKHPVGGKGR